jgi:molybdopterin-biosynthesis enzyme MoeA-like protein
MATVPESADVLLNPVGWSPCLRLHAGAATLFVLPGPPVEMQACFDCFLRDYFGSGHAGHSVARRLYVTVHEGEVAPVALQLMDAIPGTSIKGYIALRTAQRLPLDVVTRGADEAEAQANLEQAVALLTVLVECEGRQVTG